MIDGVGAPSLSKSLVIPLIFSFSRSSQASGEKSFGNTAIDSSLVLAGRQYD